MPAQRLAWLACCASAALAASDAPELRALAADDECAAGGPVGGDCGLNALQFRGARDARAAGMGIYVERSLVADEGRQLAAYDPVSLEACEAKCDSTSGCQSFTYGVADKYKGQCFLKAKAVSPNDDTSSTDWNVERFRTYYKAGTLGGGRYLERSLVANEGQGVADYTGKTAEACAALCDANPSCHSFSFGFGAKAGLCYLKDQWVSASDAQTQVPYNQEHFRTYYRVQAASEPVPTARPDYAPTPSAPTKTETKDFVRATSCKPAQIIVSTAMCAQAAQALGITPTRPRVVPPEESTLPPGCMVGPGLRQWPAGMWFNSLGLQKGFFRPESSQSVMSSDGFELLCKREPYTMSAVSGSCDSGASVEDRGECDQAAQWLHLGAPKDVPASVSMSSPTGCFKGPDGMWFNKPMIAITAASEAAQGAQRICRTEAV